MSQQITRSTTPSLFNQTIYKAFTSTFNAFPSVLERVFNVENSTSAFELYQEIGGFSKHKYKAEGAKAVSDSIVQGPQTLITNESYALSYEVSQEFLDDSRYKDIIKNVLGLAKSAAETREILGINLYNLGFSTTIYDGKPWFAVDHPILKPGSNGETTSANRPVVGSSLSEASLTIDTENMTKILEPGGLKQNINPQMVFVPVESRVEIQKLLESTLEANSSNNAINVFARGRGFFPKGYEWSPFLTDPDAYFYKTDVDGAVYQKRTERLVMEDMKNRQMVQEVVSFFRLAFGVPNWRSAYGNPGS